MVDVSIYYVITFLRRHVGGGGGGGRTAWGLASPPRRTLTARYYCYQIIIAATSVFTHIFNDKIN